MNNGVIWEYTLPNIENPTVEMPVGAHILSVQGSVVDTTRGWDICLWALVDPTEVRKFLVVPTGGIIEDDRGLKYLGTAILQTVEGYPTYHVFER